MNDQDKSLLQVLGFAAGAAAGFLLFVVIEALVVGLILQYLVGLSVTFNQVLGCCLIYELLKPRFQSSN